MSIKKGVVKKYVQYGFTYIIESDESQRPQYILCQVEQLLLSTRKTKKTISKGAW